MRFDDAVRSLDPANLEPSEASIDLGQGRVLNTRFRGAGKADCLIVQFHGAVDRRTRTIPTYSGFQPGLRRKAHQLSLADPTLQIDDELGLAWFIGSEGFDVQSLLKDYLDAAIRHLGVSRVVFFGSSGGGFAALYYSWHIPGSIALAACPQTRLTSYYPRHQERFMRLAWPNATDLDALPGGVVTDVCKLYAQGHDNTVVCLVSQGDTFHLTNHVLPLSTALSARAKKNFALECGYWGRPDHSGSVTAEAFLPWLTACVTAPSTQALDLIAHHYTLVQAQALHAAPAPAAAPAAAAGPADKPAGSRYSEADLKFAAMLHKLQLNA